jgi:ubiquinone/menaquinone biosynthesis C-methylase UbiE
MPPQGTDGHIRACVPDPSRKTRWQRGNLREMQRLGKTTLELGRTLVYRHLLANVKKQRALTFIEVMRPTPGETILDIGSGDGSFWSSYMPPAALKGVRVLSLDLAPSGPPRPGFVVADALHLPFPDKSVDIAFSNSVLEHVGPANAQARYVSEIRRVSKRFFVQAPNRHFPIEPHCLIPFIQYLPAPAQAWICKKLFGYSEEVHLPSYRTMRSLFPTAKIQRERLLGLTKAFYAHGGQ